MLDILKTEHIYKNTLHMHEIKFSNEIIFHLKDTLSRYKKVKFLTVNLSLSPLSHVTPESLKEAFQLLAEAENLKNVKLEFKPLSIKINCKDCGYIFESLKPAFYCIKCSSANIDIKKERELFINSIEIESKE